MKFRKKPIIIEAFMVGDIFAKAPLPPWLSDAITSGAVALDWEKSIASVSTLEGVMTAQSADMVIRGVKDELYPCKPDIFEATYEEVPS